MMFDRKVLEDADPERLRCTFQPGEPVQVFSCALGLTVALNSRDALALVVSAILLIGTV